MLGTMRAWWLAKTAECYGKLGDFDEAFAQLERAEAAADIESSGAHRDVIVHACNQLSRDCIAAARWDDAIRLGGRAYELVSTDPKLAQSSSVPAIRTDYADALTYAGRYSEALQHYEAVLNDHRTLPYFAERAGQLRDQLRRQIDSGTDHEESLATLLE